MRQVLNAEFELVPFNGLKKPHSDDKVLSLSESCAEQADE